MSSSPYSCSACEVGFSQDFDWREHFKSDFHRHNLKRRITDLPSVSYDKYAQQLGNGEPQGGQEWRCDMCAKMFKSEGTYEQHLKSNRHREGLRVGKRGKDSVGTGQKTRSCSEEEISLVGVQGRETQSCPFCLEIADNNHLLSHNFPPFPENCVDAQGLKKRLVSDIESGLCIFCTETFGSGELVREHMKESGHMRINGKEIWKYNQFYEWSVGNNFENLLKQEMGGKKNRKKLSFDGIRESKTNLFSLNPEFVHTNTKQYFRKHFTARKMS